MPYCKGEKEYVELINRYRKRLEKMLMDKNIKMDKELVRLSQELDELIVEFYRYKEKNKDQ